MPAVSFTLTPDVLPCVAWTDSEYHPDDLVVWLGPVAGAVIGVALYGYGFGLFAGLLLGGGIGKIVHTGFLKFRARHRQCLLLRSPQGLLFAAQPDTRSAHQNTIPYAELTGFAVVAASEWFDRRRDRPPHEAVDAIDPLVLLAQMRNGAQAILAAHVGSQQDMAELHATLTDCFIAKRRQWR